MRLGESRTPDGMRLYAVGDVHGCDDMLAEAHTMIAADLADSPVKDHRIIHVGDYIDRGPDSAAVIERLLQMTRGDPRVVCLKGNHDALLTGFLTDPEANGPTWLGNGGDETLRSYDIMAGQFFWGRADWTGLSRRFKDVLPGTHRAFMQDLWLTVRFGDYLFVHAGIRPRVPLEAQVEDDLIWIREDFLWDASDHGVVVVHGHTPVTIPEVLPNRINIDTGAVYGGVLTCLVLEGTEYRFL